MRKGKETDEYKNNEGSHDAFAKEFKTYFLKKISI
jgi:hypothetical protein